MIQPQPTARYETSWPVSHQSPPLALQVSTSHSSSSGNGSDPESSYGFPPTASRSLTVPPLPPAAARSHSQASDTSSTHLQNPQEQGLFHGDSEGRPGSDEKAIRPGPGLGQPRRSSQERERGCSAWMSRAVSTKLQWAYLGVLALQAVIILALQGTIFGLIAARVSTSTNEMQAIQVYLAIFIFAEVFQLALAFDGLRLKNSLQLYGLVMFQVAMLAYAALMPAQLREALEAIGRLDVWRIVEGMLIAIPIVLGVSIVMVAAMTYFIQIEIGWSVFKLLGASLGIKRMFFFYQILVTLLKFDLFFWIGFAIQFIILVSNRADYEVALTIVGMPVVIAICIIGAVSVRKESRIGMALYAAGLIAAMIYFVWKLVRIFTARDPSGRNPYQSNERSLALFSAVSIALLAATMLSSLLVLLNFGHGLKEALPSYSKGTRRKEKQSHHEVEPDRVSID